MFQILTIFLISFMFVSNLAFAKVNSQPKQNILKSLQVNKSLYRNYELFLRGEIFLDQKKYKRAIKILRPLLRTKNLTPAFKNRVLFMISQSYLGLKNWKRASYYLAKLEKKWRNNKRHPQILWQLVSSELKRKRRPQSCFWARKLYSRHPSYDLIYDWSLSLERVKFDGKILSCKATERDQMRRIRRLQWEGESERAKAELDQLDEQFNKQRIGNKQNKQIDAKRKYALTRLRAFYLVNEGYSDQAFKILIPLYAKKKKDFNYLILLAKSAFRSGEVQTAVAAYYQGYKLNPKLRKSRQALFNSAFLSYHFQYYKGAQRKFKELIKEYPRLELSRDAQYHLTWIHYLKGNYKKSILGFKRILYQKKKQKFKWSKYSEEHIKYWLAVSYYRLKKFDLAKPIFLKLMSDPLLGYYSLLSQQRYNSIPFVKKISRIYKNKVRDLRGLVSQETLRKVAAEYRIAEGMGAPEEEIKKIAKVIKSNSSSVRGNKLRKELQGKISIQRAKGFLKLGLRDWAYWELRRAEQLNGSLDQMRELIGIYNNLKLYKRSAFIAQFSFVQERKSKGVAKSAQFWHLSYPRVYKREVSNVSKKLNIDASLIWAIIKSESSYNKNAISAVGARGLMQIMPHTARRVTDLVGGHSFKNFQLYNPGINIFLGTRYIKRLLKKFSGEIPLAVAAYNAGPHRVKSWLVNFEPLNLDMDEFIEHIPFDQTRAYTKKVLRYLSIYKLLYKAQDRSLASLPQKISVRINHKPATRENWEEIDQKGSHE